MTKEEREAAVQEKEKRILEEQQLANLMQKGLLLEALGLAIHLDQPFRTLNILKGILVSVALFGLLLITASLLRFDGSRRSCIS